MKFGVRDKKIMAELFVDSSQSNRAIAKKVNCSKETVGSKIDYYLESGIIKNFSLTVDYSKLGFIEYNLFIRMTKISAAKLKGVIRYWEKNKNTTWIGKSFGKYDLKISMIVMKDSDVTVIISDFYSNFAEYIDEVDYVLVEDKFKASSELFLKKLLDMETSKIKVSQVDNSGEIELDEMDRRILVFLGGDSRISYVDLANKLKVSAQLILYRVKRMEKLKVIKGYGVVFDGNKLNKVWCLVLLSVNLNSVENLKSYLKRKEFVSSFSQTMGFSNFNVTFFADNIEELYLSLNQIREKFSSGIRDFDFLIFFELFKYPKVPECILEEK